MSESTSTDYDLQKMKRRRKKANQQDNHKEPATETEEFKPKTLMEERPLEAPTPRQTVIETPPQQTVIAPPPKQRKKKVSIAPEAIKKPKGCDCDGSSCGCETWNGAVKRRSKKFY